MRQKGSSLVTSGEGVRERVDRPLLETKEFLAGALVVNCASQERALELAAMIPLAQFRRVELREIRMDQDDFLLELDQL